MSKYTKVAVIGAGSWGTALAQLVSEHCEQVSLIARSAEMAEHINQQHRNPQYIKDLDLSDNIVASVDLGDTCDAEVIVIAIPTSVIRSNINLLKEYGVREDAIIVSVAKGIERGSGLRMSQIISEILPNNPVAVLSGPNHAEEVSLDYPTCTVIGCEDLAVATKLQSIFASTTFRTYTCDDVAGMEWGGAIKNIFAIAAGIAQGLQLGDNAIAALVTRGLAEMTRVGQEFGAKKETFYGLSGVGDLMTTCYSPHSRNHQVGLALAKGLTVNQTTEQLGMVAEGIRNTQSIYEQVQLKELDTPLIKAVYAIIYQGVSPTQALQELFTRELKPEA